LRNFDQERLHIELLMEGNIIHQNRTIETFSSNVACELVRHGVGVGLVDGLSALQVVDDGLTCRQFDPAMYMDVCVITPEYWTLPLIARDLVEYLKSKADETQKRITSTLQV
jgi:DNA-binding transcriptional LysR family regulator